MEELKQTSVQFQRKILDYIPGEFSFCISQDFVCTVINDYHGRTMLFWPYVLKEKNGQTLKLKFSAYDSIIENVLKGNLPDEELESLEENGYDLFIKGNLNETLIDEIDENYESDDNYESDENYESDNNYENDEHIINDIDY